MLGVTRRSDPILTELRIEAREVKRPAWLRFGSIELRPKVGESFEMHHQLRGLWEARHSKRDERARCDVYPELRIEKLRIPAVRDR
jgi:hypothetical protein